MSTAVIFALLMWEWVANLRPIYGLTMAAGGKGAATLQAFGPQAVYDVIAVLGLSGRRAADLDDHLAVHRGCPQALGGKG